jgi:hypothetical protein
MRILGGVVVCLVLLSTLGVMGQQPAVGPDSPAIGLAVGRGAPAFEAVDQFGHMQNLATLRGTGGTILLFFRSADW